MERELRGDHAQDERGPSMAFLRFTPLPGVRVASLTTIVRVGDAILTPGKGVNS